MFKSFRFGTLNKTGDESERPLIMTRRVFEYRIGHHASSMCIVCK